MNKVKTRGLLALALVALLAVPALAHDMWITFDKTQAGQPAHILVGYGHAFPANEGTEAEKLMPAYLVGPKGRLECKAGDKLDFVSVAPLAEGSYLAVSGRQAQWYTNSPEGSQDKPKNQVPGATQCIRSVKYAKAVLNLGKTPGDVSQPVGQNLEIVPLVNPGAIKAGGELPIQVLFEGKPLGNSQVFATFAGFSAESNVFAFASKTDKQGKTTVKVWHPGQWLVLAKHETPFSDPAECDKFYHSAALTFDLK